MAKELIPETILILYLVMKKSPNEFTLFSVSILLPCLAFGQFHFSHIPERTVQEDSVYYSCKDTMMYDPISGKRTNLYFMFGNLTIGVFSEQPFQFIQDFEHKVVYHEKSGDGYARIYQNGNLLFKYTISSFAYDGPALCLTPSGQIAGVFIMRRNKLNGLCTGIGHDQEVEWMARFKNGKFKGYTYYRGVPKEDMKGKNRRSTDPFRITEIIRY